MNKTDPWISAIQRLTESAVESAVMAGSATSLARLSEHLRREIAATLLPVGSVSVSVVENGHHDVEVSMTLPKWLADMLEHTKMETVAGG